MRLVIPITLTAIALTSTCCVADDAADAALTVAVRAAVKEVAPAVLRVETFGGLEKVGDVLIGSGPSTGVVVSEDGYVLCSAYTFAQQPTSILVTMPSGKRAAAEVVARDHSRMLVLLRVNSQERLTPPAVVGRDAMTVGQTTVALGRTYDTKTPNVSVGILSATHRVWGKAIQTDAKISPANYGGPLIDLQGRVLGILVPMSPQAEGALAGAQWYDSGIGFAVPLAEVLTHLETLRRGDDLHPGKLGVSLAGKGDFQMPVKIAAVLPGSPAAKAGLNKGDEIVEVEGSKIRWMAHLKHAMGPRYAGETVEVVYKREDKLATTSVTLVGEIAPYDVPFLGILPMRDTEGSVNVRYVYPESPAARAGIEVGDVITSCANVEVRDVNQLRNIIGTHDRKAGDIQIVLRREGKFLQRKLAIASLPTAIPDALPPARRAKPPANERPATGLVEIKVPEIANNCYVFVPEGYHADAPHGLLVWLHAPGDFDKDTIAATWREVSQQHDLIVVVPEPARADAWQPTEVEFVRKAIDEVVGAYNIGENRIVVGGHQAGGTFAAIVGIANIEVVRGIAMVDAAVPSRASIPASDPVQRTAYYVATASQSKLKDSISAGIKRLRDNKLPVSQAKLGQQPRRLNDDERQELARWVGSDTRLPHGESYCYNASC